MDGPKNLRLDDLLAVRAVTEFRIYTANSCTKASEYYVADSRATGADSANTIYIHTRSRTKQD